MSNALKSAQYPRGLFNRSQNNGGKNQGESNETHRCSTRAVRRDSVLASFGRAGALEHRSWNWLRQRVRIPVPAGSDSGGAGGVLLPATRYLHSVDGCTCRRSSASPGRAVRSFGQLPLDAGGRPRRNVLRQGLTCTFHGRGGKVFTTSLPPKYFFVFIGGSSKIRI